GVDFRQLARALVDRLRDLLILVAVPNPAGLVALEGDRLAASRRLAEKAGWERLERMARLFSQAEADMRRGESPRLTLELACLEALRVGSLEDRVRELESRVERLMSQGAGVFGSPASSAPEPVPPPESSPARRPPPAGPPELPATPQARQVPAVPSDEPAAPASPEAPTASSAPSRPAPLDAAGAEAVDLSALWDGVLAELSRTAAGRSTHAFAREARLAAIRGGEAYLVFPSGYDFHRSNLSQKVHRDRVQRLLGRQVGRPLQVFILSEKEWAEEAGGVQEAAGAAEGQAAGREAVAGGEGRGAGAAMPAEAEALKDPLVRKAVEFFGGHLVRVESKEPR
ncbi:MAG TPA: hypothetical protein VIL08_06150, partial [Limnochorda sp.]